MSDPLAPLPRSPWRRALGSALGRAVAWRWRAFQRARTGRVDLTRGGPERLVVTPGVFHPDFYFTSWPLARAVAQWVQRRGGEPRVLDLGSGSGATAVLAARAGARVIAVDLDEAAVRCTRLNAALCGLADRIDARAGDLFAPVAGERFDLLAFNPPYFEGAPGPGEQAFKGGPRLETLRRFLEGAPAHLAPGGEALLALTTRADLDAAREHLAGWDVRLVWEEDRIFEQVRVIAVRLRG